MAGFTNKLGNNRLILLVDLIVFALCSFVAAIVVYDVSWATYFNQLPTALVVVAVSLYLLSVFEISLDVSLSSLMSRTLLSVALALSILLVIIYVLGPGSGRNVYGRGILSITVISFSGYLLITRYALFQLLKRINPFQHWVFIGSDNQFEQLEKDIRNYNRHKIVRRSVDWMADNLHSLKDRGVVLGDVHGADSDMPRQLIGAKFNGAEVTNLDQFYEMVLERVPLFNIDEDWFFNSTGFSYVNDSIRQRVKKALDMALVFLSLPITVPLLLISTILIVILDKQNPFYTQSRTGQHGRCFTIFKLRTMKTSAKQNETGEWTSADDNRVSRLGNVLRKYRLDEIPQLLNVVMGNMSIIGPRPEQPNYTAMLAEQIPYYDIRHAIKPGITGWAQVRFPYGASVVDARSKLEYDLYYIKNYSLLLDISILIKTIYTIVSGSGR